MSNSCLQQEQKRRRREVQPGVWGTESCQLAGEGWSLGLAGWRYLCSLVQCAVRPEPSTSIGGVRACSTLSWAEPRLSLGVFGPTCTQIFNIYKQCFKPCFKPCWRSGVYFLCMDLCPFSHHVSTHATRQPCQNLLYVIPAPQPMPTHTYHPQKLSLAYLKWQHT